MRSVPDITDPDVVEIPPPPFVRRKFRSNEKKPIISEVVEIDDDDSVDPMVIDGELDMKDSGSTLENKSGSSYGKKVKDELGAMSEGGSWKNSGPTSSNVAHDGFDITIGDYGYDDIMNTEDLAMVQALFDSLDLPTGVEASVPWFTDPPLSKKKVGEGSSASGNHGGGSSRSFESPKPSHIGKNMISVSSSSLQKPVDASTYHAGQYLGKPSGSARYLSPGSGGLKSEKKATRTIDEFTNQLMLEANSHPKTPKLHQSGASVPSVGVNGKPSRWGPPVNAFSGAGSSAFLKHGGFNVVPPPPPPVLIPGKLSKSPYLHQSGAPLSFDGTNVAIPLFSSWTGQSYSHSVFTKHMTPLGKSDGPDVSPQEIMDLRNNLKAVNEEDIIKKFKLFKKFDTVEDFSDHHYFKSGVNQPSKKWSKKIQDEWRILENDLPDTILVRVCETRMDLMRAVIIGAEGTPYHDGLFFFDIFFPPTYPAVPPNVYYHSGGLRLNPNLYACGKVCLSLLNTWAGGRDEKWLPEMSTMLQVLVSIQALILNQNPYFNEPGYENSRNTPRGETQSRQYNENTLILSLRTMMYTIKKPPKPFQDFVVGHFYSRAHGILVACRAYVEGAQVGCLVKGGVQDVDVAGACCSQIFKGQVAQSANLLVKELTLLGVKDCEQFLIDTNSVKSQAAAPNTPKTKSKVAAKLQVH